MLLNNERVNNKIKGEIKGTLKQIKIWNQQPKTDGTQSSNAIRKIHAYFKKQKIAEISSLTLHWKEPEKE